MLISTQIGKRTKKKKKSKRKKCEKEKVPSWCAAEQRHREKKVRERQRAETTLGQKVPAQVRTLNDAAHYGSLGWLAINSRTAPMVIAVPRTQRVPGPPMRAEKSKQEYKEPRERERARA
jgi:hypothetical protein